MGVELLMKLWAGPSGPIREMFLNLQLANQHQMKAEVTPIKSISCTQFRNITFGWNSGVRAGPWSNDHSSSLHSSAMLVDFKMRISHSIVGLRRSSSSSVLLLRTSSSLAS